MALHLAGLRPMLLRWEKHCLSSTIQFKYDGQFLGMISRIVRSSTYLAHLGHVLTRSLTITENSTGPNLVPWGIPPFRERKKNRSLCELTVNDLAWRKATIHLTRQGCRLQECNLLKRMVWSKRSNPFLKSAKKSLVLQLPLSKASRTRWSTYVIAWWVDIPAVANCLQSRYIPMQATARGRKADNRFRSRLHGQMLYLFNLFTKNRANFVTCLHESLWFTKQVANVF